MPITSLSQGYRRAAQRALCCLTWCLLSVPAGALGESGDEVPDPDAAQQTDNADLAADQPNSASPANDDPIVVELDIPPELEAFLAAQDQQSPQREDAPTGDAELAPSTQIQPETSTQAQPETSSGTLTDSDNGQATAEPAASTPADPPQAQALLEELPYRTCFRSAAATYQIEESLLIGIAIVESSLDPNAVSSANALGLMQIKWPITANHLGIEERQALFDPCTNIDAGARYLRELLDDLGSFALEPRMRLALASYRLGPNGFDPNLPLPANAQDYIERVRAQQDTLGASADAPGPVTVSGPVLPCVVENLRQLAAVTHDPSQRNAQFGNWLTARGQGCSALALIKIRNNMPTWLGTGLTPELEAQVIALLELSIEGTSATTSR